MLSRTAVGMGAGAVAGVGFALSLNGLRWYCHDKPGPITCDDSDPLLLSPIFSFWLLVVGVLVHVGFRRGRLPHRWRVIGLGSGLWIALTVPVAWFRAAYLDGLLPDGHSFPDEYGRNFMMVASVITACVAYRAAASFKGRSRGEGAVESSCRSAHPLR
ncbi:hypothetical protein ACWEIJ_26045 [Lentzea sp. NPDC004789]